MNTQVLTASNEHCLKWLGMLRLGTKQAKLSPPDLDAQTALYLREMRKVSSAAVTAAVNDLLNDCEFLPSVKELKNALWANERRINPPVAAIAHDQGKREKKPLSATGAAKLKAQLDEYERCGTIDGRPVTPAVVNFMRAGLEKFEAEKAA